MGRKKHDCNCPDCPHKKRDRGDGTAGFAIGAALGAVAAGLMAPQKGEKTRKQAKVKFEELTRGRSVDDIVAQVRKAADGVIADIKDAAGEGKKEAAKEKRRILREDQ
ncbi:MAG: YtxH domain-containing protein [Patescibacteria group bacterium]|nr:YtxH domain-containing protein [Patescibacteria group bacterium]